MIFRRPVLLLIILFLIPVFFGGVQITPFADFFQNPSWSSFTKAFGEVFKGDIEFYKNLLGPLLKK